MSLTRGTFNVVGTAMVSAAYSVTLNDAIPRSNETSYVCMCAVVVKLCVSIDDVERPPFMCHLLKKRLRPCVPGKEGGGDKIEILDLQRA